MCMHPIIAKQKLTVERSNRQIYNYSWKLQHPLSIIGRISKQKISMGYRFGQYYQWTVLN